MPLFRRAAGARLMVILETGNLARSLDGRGTLSLDSLTIGGVGEAHHVEGGEAPERPALYGQLHSL